MELALFFIIALVIIGAFWWHRYRSENLHFDDGALDAVWESGFSEHVADIPDGGRIAYIEGPDNGPELLLVHMQMTGWQDYAEALPSLACSYHVFAVDCFGHGESTHDPAYYPCKVNAMELAWFIVKIIGRSCIVSGNGTGGIIAAWLGAYAPECVRGLVLEDPPLLHVGADALASGSGCLLYNDVARPCHTFIQNGSDGDFVIQCLETGTMASSFDSMRDKLLAQARQWRSVHPRGPLKLQNFPHEWFRMLQWADDFDPHYGDALYEGSWMAGIDEQEMLHTIACPTVYLKSQTEFDDSGMLLSANDDDEARRAVDLMGPTCKMVPVKRCGQNVHYEKPHIFQAAVDVLDQEVLG